MKKSILSIVLVSIGSLFQACSQEVETQTPLAQSKDVSTKTEKNKSVLHPFGGWFCPDNLTGLPPTDIKQLEKIPVVKGRLPTKEETKNGSALIFIDTAEIPNAKPLDLGLPRLAKYYSDYSKKEELIIVFQALTAEEDTVVGFRFPSGGNGSAWIREIKFLDNSEIENIEATQFVFIEKELKTSKSEIWNKLKKTSYFENLSENFGLKPSVNVNWSPNTYIPIEYYGETENAVGTISDHFGGLYLQINYKILGRDYVEKLLVMENEEKGTAKLQWVAGPFGNEYNKELINWQNFIEELSN